MSTPLALGSTLRTRRTLGSGMIAALVVACVAAALAAARALAGDGTCCNIFSGACTPGPFCDKDTVPSGSSTCDPNPCAGAGACCDPTNGFCHVAAYCGFGNAPASPPSRSCSPNPCSHEQPIGACCDGYGLCRAVFMSYCGSSEIWTATAAGGVACVPNPCVPLGSCCNFIVGTCWFVAQSDCGPRAHTWTPHRICSPNICDAVGACCDTSMVCRRRTQAQCTGPALAWSAQTCSTVPCTLNGRCCNFVTGSCAVTLHGVCGTGAHTWEFGGTCSPNTCDAVGACCIAAHCRSRTQSVCLAESGTWTSGAGCSPSPCAILLAASNLCPADFNRSGSVEMNDLFDFLSAWLAGDLRTDLDSSGFLDVQDIVDFVNIWFTGC